MNTHTMSTSTVVFPQLSAENFNNWKFRVKAILEEKQVVIVLEKEISDSSTEKEKADFKIMDAKAKYLIIQCVTDKHLDIIKDSSTAKQMIKALEDVFERKSVFTKLSLKKKLLTLKCKSNERLEDHFQRFDAIVRELDSIGSKCEESDKICYLLLSLPEDYNIVVTAIETLNKDVTMDYVKARLLDEELKSKTNYSKTSSEVVFNCYRCGKSGHMIKDCKQTRRQNFRGRRGFNHFRGRGQSQSSQQANNAENSIAFIALNCNGQINKRNCFILDSGATEHLVTSELLEHMSNIQDLKVPVKIGTAKHNQILTATRRGELNCTCENKKIKIDALIVEAGCRALDSAGIKDIQIENFCDSENAAQGALLGTWKFQENKTKKETFPKINLYNATDENNKDWSIGAIKAESQNLARKLADTPANLLTPTIFANEAQNILCPLGIEVTVYDQKWAEEQKMFSFLSVNRGSSEPPKFLEISYNSTGKSESPFVLVGKGVTFDSGGISLKSAAGMDEMRADMGGAAAVLGATYGLAKLKAPVNLKVLIPLVENMPSGSATKPGDVIRARNGKTICVDNTDAEGRLILADALCYSEEFKPKWVLDVATLTGAMVVALGNAATGVFSNSDTLYNTLQSAGSITGDRVWRMPLWKIYSKHLGEQAAFDLNNISKKKGGGSCTAAAFLREFIPNKTDWLHLDIAGVMGSVDDTPYLHKGMTGRPTRTLIEFILAQVKC